MRIRNITSPLCLNDSGESHVPSKSYVTRNTSCNVYRIVPSIANVSCGLYVPMYRWMVALSFSTSYFLYAYNIHIATKVVTKSVLFVRLVAESVHTICAYWPCTNRYDVTTRVRCTL